MNAALRPVLKNEMIPIASMCGIFTYMWLIYMGNVGKYTIHGWYGICKLRCSPGPDYASGKEVALVVGFPTVILVVTVTRRESTLICTINFLAPKGGKV